MSVHDTCNEFSLLYYMYLIKKKIYLVYTLMFCLLICILLTFLALSMCNYSVIICIYNFITSSQGMLNMFLNLLCKCVRIFTLLVSLLILLSILHVVLLFFSNSILSSQQTERSFLLLLWFVFKKPF